MELAPAELQPVEWIKKNSRIIFLLDPFEFCFHCQMTRISITPDALDALQGTLASWKVLIAPKNRHSIAPSVHERMLHLAPAQHITKGEKVREAHRSSEESDTNFPWNLFLFGGKELCSLELFGINNQWPVACNLAIEVLAVAAAVAACAGKHI